MAEELGRKARELVSRMTEEQKVAICSGAGFWDTKGMPGLGIGSFVLTDGPNGVRRQVGEVDNLGLYQSLPATCFPPACAMACSFDPELARQVGRAIGEECRAQGVAVLLGPAVNMKRSPLCGRNFEYYSEDPLLSGRMAAGMISGVQSQNVGTSLKHFAANNQERSRCVEDSIVDERALRETYLAGFETAVREAQPWAVMCAYNRVNGTYACENKRLLTDILRHEWGFEGMTVTDWGAMDNRPQANEAGMDLEMPGPSADNDKLALSGLEAGTLSRQRLDECASHVVELALRAVQNESLSFSAREHDDLAATAARESAVLVANDGVLPLKEGTKVAIIGEYAEKPKYQGGGSSHINATKVTSLLNALDAAGIPYTFSQGFDGQGETDPKRKADALRAAGEADVAIVMLALPDIIESEGYDRRDMRLPRGENEVVEALAGLDEPVVAVLNVGSPVELPWKDDVSAILVPYLAGQNSGTALAELLWGKVSPSGRLAETWPLRLEDTPAYGFFGASGNVEYRESIYIGYRFYEKAQRKVAFPFGHGLGYSPVEYERLTLDLDHIEEEQPLAVAVSIRNAGQMPTKEIVQVYIAPPQEGIFRPVRGLAAFAKVELAPGERKTVDLVVPPRAFQYFDARKGGWRTDRGTYVVEVGASSADIRLSAPVEVSGQEPDSAFNEKVPAYAHPEIQWPVPAAQFEAVLGHPVPDEPKCPPFTVNSTLSQIMSVPAGKAVVDRISQGLPGIGAPAAEEDTMARMARETMGDMPLRQLCMFSGGAFTMDDAQRLVDQLNAKGNE